MVLIKLFFLLWCCNNLRNKLVFNKLEPNPCKYVQLAVEDLMNSYNLQVSRKIVGESFQTSSDIYCFRPRKTL